MAPPWLRAWLIRSFLIKPIHRNAVYVLSFIVPVFLYRPMPSLYKARSVCVTPLFTLVGL